MKQDQRRHAADRSTVSPETRETLLACRIRQLAEAMPPLSAERRERLAALLRPPAAGPSGAAERLNR